MPRNSGKLRASSKTQQPAGRRKRRTPAEVAAALKSFEPLYDKTRNREPLSSHSIGSKKRVWWRCARCKQSYLCSVEAKIYLGAKCTICREQPLQGDRWPILRKIFCEKDNRIALDAVRRGSSQNYWFRCLSCGTKRKRSIKTVVSALARGGQPPCDHCYRRGGRIQLELERRNQSRIAAVGSFADKFPGMAAEWDAERNKKSPRDYLAGSGYVAHWVCKAGHKWKASINDRVKDNRGCRKCGQHISQYEKRVVAELQALGFSVAWNERHGGVECDVLLRKQGVAIEVDGFPWHDSEEAYARERKKEATLRKVGVTVVRWRCSQLKRRRVRSRLYRHQQDNSRTIKKLFRLVLSEGSFSRKEAEKLRAYCSSRKGYIADAAFNALHNTTATELFRESVADACPHLLSSWSSRNEPLKPTQVSKGSKRKVWWRCEADPSHEWQSRPADRRRFGCPFCNLRRASPADNFYVNHKAFCDTYVCRKRSSDDLKAKKMFKSLWVKCVNGHEFQLGLANLNDRRRIDGEKTFSCPKCKAVMPYDGRPLIKGRRSLAVIKRLWDRKKNSVDPLFLVPNQSDRYWWRCPKGHQFQQTLIQILSTRHKSFQCPTCGRSAKHHK